MRAAIERCPLPPFTNLSSFQFYYSCHGTANLHAAAVCTCWFPGLQQHALHRSLPDGHYPSLLTFLLLPPCCSGFRLEPRMLQQYASLQRQSDMPSVRIPPPAHDGGGLYNPFNPSSGGGGGAGGGYSGAFSCGFSGLPPGLRDFPMQQQQQQQQVRLVPRRAGIA